MSVETTRVRWPRSADSSAVAAAMLVFPTPPLPVLSRIRVTRRSSGGVGSEGSDRTATWAAEPELDTGPLFLARAADGSQRRGWEAGAMDGSPQRGLSRRRFLAATAAGGTAALLGGPAALAARPSQSFVRAAKADAGAIWFEKSIPEL